MNIGIVGNYGHDNNGDEAILEGILLQLREEYGLKKEETVIFSNNPENTEARYDIKSVYLIKKRGSFLKSVLATIRQHIQVVRSLDVLIMGGGGVLMDMFKRDAPLYSTLVFIARMFNCKIVIYGVGAGPINTALGKTLISGMAKASSVIAVRDADSKALLNSIGIKKQIEVIPDPALALGGKNTREKTDQITKVGVTAVPYYSAAYWPVSDEQVYASYTNNLARCLDEIVGDHGAEITFFSTKYPQDVQVTKDILGKMMKQSSAVVIEDNLHPQQLLEISKNLDVVIGTRLHSVILAVAAGTPVIGIGYHHKVEAFMKRIDRTDMFVSLSELEDAGCLSSKVSLLAGEWESVQESAEMLSSKLKGETEDARRLLDKVIDR
ncbi:polysaccharide pyruvyl transferase family protein [Bacillus sp. AK031]